MLQQPISAYAETQISTERAPVRGGLWRRLATAAEILVGPGVLAMLGENDGP